MLLAARADELIRFWGHEVKVKVMRLIMYAKIACDRIIIRTD